MMLAFIFGSVARGEEGSTSDVDLFVLGSVSLTDIVGELTDSHERLGREVNPIILSPGEFSEKYPSDPFLQRILTEPKIYIVGDADDVTKLVADGPTEGA